jgi:hypothetical protein
VSEVVGLDTALVLDRYVEVEQMMVRLLAEVRTSGEEMKTNKAKTDANLRELRGCRKLLKDEMLAKLYIYHERMTARMSPQLEKMEACIENI